MQFQFIIYSFLYMPSNWFTVIVYATLIHSYLYSNPFLFVEFNVEVF